MAQFFNRLLILTVSIGSWTIIPNISHSSELYHHSRAVEFFQKKNLDDKDVDIFTNRSFLAQNIIDEIYTELLITSFGQKIIRQILECSTALLKTHIGISNNLALQLTGHFCQASGAHHTDPWIFASPESDFTKIVSNKQKSKRSYRFNFSKNNYNSSLDSWTDFRTQTTTIYFDMNISYIQFKKKLLFVLAHETAIYFDQKSQLNKSTWLEHPELKTYIVSDNDSVTRNDFEDFLTAINNPLIAQVLSYIRAFRIEERWIKQLPQEILNKYSIHLKKSYGYFNFPFLDPTCQIKCLKHLLRSASLSISDYALPLLGNTRYWTMKVTQLSLSPPTLNTKTIKKILIDYRNYYVSRSRVTIENHLESRSRELQEISSETADVFEKLLIPEDLETIFRFQLYRPPQLGPTTVMFLTQPSLGNFGIEMAAGPRPRIRTGSSYSINLELLSKQQLALDNYPSPRLADNFFQSKLNKKLQEQTHSISKRKVIKNLIFSKKIVENPILHQSDPYDPN